MQWKKIKKKSNNNKNNNLNFLIIVYAYQKLNNSNKGNVPQNRNN